MLGEKGQRGALERPTAGCWNPILLLRPRLWTRAQAQSETLSLRDGRKEFKMEGRKKGPWMGGIIGNGNKLNFPFCCVPVPSRCTSYSINHHTPDPGPLSLLPSGLGIGVRDPIRGVSVMFVFPIFPPIYGLQIFIETRPWLSKDRKRLFEIVSPFSHSIQ